MPAMFSPQQVGFTIGQIGLNLALAFALSYLAALFYRRTHDGPSFSRSFFLTLVVVPVVVAMIMMAIGSNFALSLGLVGALSVIRYRTAIKDTRDMAFLFLVIGIGLCCGTGAYPLALFGTGFALAVLWAVNRATLSGFSPSEYILIFRRNGEGAEQIDSAIQGMTSWRKLHSIADLGTDETSEYTYRVRLLPSVLPEALLAKLRQVRGLTQTSLIAPESQLSI